MKTALVLIVGVLGLSSCESLKLGKTEGEEAANPYQYAEEGAWGSSGGYAQAGATDPNSAAHYNQVYEDAANWHDEVNVVPFTDNGSGGSSTRPSKPASTAVKKSSPKAPASAKTAAAKKSGATKKSANLAASSRATSGASSGKGKTAARRGSPRRHTVKAGDTLYEISRSYRVSVDNLKRRNQLDSDLIRVGEELSID